MRSLRNLLTARRGHALGQAILVSEEDGVAEDLRRRAPIRGFVLLGTSHQVCCVECPTSLSLEGVRHDL